MGLWSPRGADAFLVRRQLDAQHVAVFNNITPEFARSIANRPSRNVQRSLSFSGPMRC